MAIMNACACRRSFCATALHSLALRGMNGLRSQEAPRAGDELSAMSHALSAGAHRP